MDAVNPIEAPQPSTREAISDYTRFDFRALWRGRDQVTAVERSIVTELLRRVRCDRLLEVGTGFGRLLPALERASRDVVACDFDRTALAGLARARPNGFLLRRVAANLYHLPFRDQSFSAVSMVRVYHHLESPERALAELHRVLAPGGRLLIAINPRPSIGTLVNDIQRGLHRTANEPFSSLTFGRGRVALPPNPFPTYAEGRRAFRRRAEAAGFREVLECGSGLEEYYLARHLPSRLFVRLAFSWGRGPGLPQRFVLLERAGGVGPLEELPARFLACPRCRADWVEDPGSDRPACARCGFLGSSGDGVLDLRYVPPGVARWGAGSP